MTPVVARVAAAREVREVATEVVAMVEVKVVAGTGMAETVVSRAEAILVVAALAVAAVVAVEAAMQRRS